MGRWRKQNTFLWWPGKILSSFFRWSCNMILLDICNFPTVNCPPQQFGHHPRSLEAAACGTSVALPLVSYSVSMATRQQIDTFITMNINRIWFIRPVREMGVVHGVRSSRVSGVNTTISRLLADDGVQTELMTPKRQLLSNVISRWEQPLKSNLKATDSYTCWIAKCCEEQSSRQHGTPLPNKIQATVNFASLQLLL